jgi:COP9 signalosome complex subunit 4
MDQKLVQLSALNQKDKGAAYLSLLSSTFSSQGNANIAHDVHALVDHLINQDAGIIAGRQVLTELVKGLTAVNIPDTELRKAVVEDVLSVVQTRATSYEEQVRAAQSKGLTSILTHRQVNLLKFELADILEHGEDWSGAARVLRGINLEASQRYIDVS